MDFAIGGSLADQLASLGRLPWHDATRRMIEAAQAIEAAHAAGIVHGSIRPSILLLMAGGQLKVADFSDGLIGPPTGDTAHYSAPELFAGEMANPASDVYSLGAAYFA